MALQRRKKMEKSKATVIDRSKELLRLAMVAVVALSLAGCAYFNSTYQPPLTVPQIVKLSKEGIPADDLIARMKVSGTVYRLKASRLAKLEKMGVPAKVINYMQQTYLDAVRNDARYEDLQYWSHEDEYGWYGGAPFGWPDFEVHEH
jgi:hypothetical protein